MMRVVWAFLLALCWFPLHAEAFSKISPGSTIALIDLGFKGESVATDSQSRTEMARVATEYIGFHLERETKFVVWTAESFGYAVDEQTLALTGGFTQDKAVEIGRAMKADYILCGNILGFGVDRHSTSAIAVTVDETKATTKLGLQLIDARTGSIIASAIADGVSGASGGVTSLPGLLKAYKIIHVPIEAYTWNNHSVNGEIVDMSLTKAANSAVSMLLEKAGITKPKAEED